jgi:hypothetical protein
MISQKENGKLGPGFAEYRIKFGYSRDGGSSYTDVTKVGRATSTVSRISEFDSVFSKPRTKLTIFFL